MNSHWKFARFAMLNELYIAQYKKNNRKFISKYEHLWALCISTAILFLLLSLFALGFHFLLWFHFATLAPIWIGISKHLTYQKQSSAFIAEYENLLIKFKVESESVYLVPPEILIEQYKMKFEELINKHLLFKTKRPLPPI